jgi:3-methyl-2-oxobutanoate hydroxymethyltransferase
LVIDDLIGLSESKFRFVKRYANTSKIIDNAVRRYKSDVLKKQFPKAKHSFKN